jgi:hypothetical protein
MNEIMKKEDAGDQRYRLDGRGIKFYLREQDMVRFG